MKRQLNDYKQYWLQYNAVNATERIYEKKRDKIKVLRGNPFSSPMRRRSPLRNQTCQTQRLKGHTSQSVRHHTWQSDNLNIFLRIIKSTNLCIFY